MSEPKFTYIDYLSVLVKNPEGMANYEVARELDTTATSINGMVPHLMSRDFIERDKGRYKITSKGKKKLKAERYEVV